MTAQSPGTDREKEYRITESQMLQIESMFHQPDWTLDDEDEKSRADLLIEIRSRPIHQAPIPIEYFRPTGCVGVCAVMPERIPELKAAIRREAYEQGAREERERIIDLLLPIFAEDNRSPFELEGCPNCDRTIRMYLESLRSGK